VPSGLLAYTGSDNQTTMDTKPTEAAILDAAQELVQIRGYNAFSYRDLSEKIGIKTASIHYYFPSKEDLCRALIGRYRRQFRAALAGIDDRAIDPGRRLELYVELFRSTLDTANRMCLCGMLAADLETLSPAVRDEIRAFFSENERWLADVLSAGLASGRFRFEGSAEGEARLLLACLEGAMLVSRAYDGTRTFAFIVGTLFEKYR